MSVVVPPDLLVFTQNSVPVEEFGVRPPGGVTSRRYPDSLEDTARSQLLYGPVRVKPAREMDK